MISGIGIDIIEIERIKKALNKPSFINRCFTEKEIQYFKKRKYNVQTIAGYFCAKEAISKSLGTGFSTFKLLDIEIIKDHNGRPTVLLKNNAMKISKQMGINNVLISISHCNTYAVANAVAIFANKEVKDNESSNS